MSFSVGIVGLPNAGKSTLFNALASRRLAETAPRAFTTIEPHEAVVPVPDVNLQKLSDLIKPEETVPASVTFIDIAGLVKDAHQGEGMGNQFLGKIREVNVIAHVVRVFSDSYVTPIHQHHEVGTLEQVLDDIEIVNLELQLANVVKPQIYVLNVDEKGVASAATKQFAVRVSDKFKGPVVTICAKLEEDLSDLEGVERDEYVKEAGIDESGFTKLIKKAYQKLNLVTFYTIKPSSAKATEGRGSGITITAWSLRRGASAIDAAEVVHTDFAKNFIKAEVVNVADLLGSGGWKEAKDNGKVRLEGKDYEVQHQDVIEFKTNA